MRAKSLQCSTLVDPMDCSLLGFSVHGIIQAFCFLWPYQRFPPDFGEFSPRAALITTLLPTAGVSFAGLPWLPSASLSSLGVCPMDSSSFGIQELVSSAQQGPLGWFSVCSWCLLGTFHAISWSHCFPSLRDHSLSFTWCQVSWKSLFNVPSLTLLFQQLSKLGFY